MNRLVVGLAVICVITIISFASAAQSSARINPEEIKHVVVPMPRGLVNAEAYNISKDWTPPIVHLKGKVSLKIYTATKDPRGAIVMHADEVDLDQTTGEISSRGSARLSVENPN